MDFRFTDEQLMMADSVRSLLADLCRPEDVRRLAGTDEPADARRWSALAEMGLLGALVAVDRGGLGLAPVDLVLVAEACGYACLPEPLIENAGVALPLLAAIADSEAAEQKLRQALAGEITVAVAHPDNLWTADADTAGAIIALLDGHLHLLDPAALTLVRQPSIDPFRRLFTLWGDVPADSLAIDAGTAAPLLAAAFETGAVLTAAQLVGIAQRAVDLAVAYARERNQFGKPIGANQAVKHELATAQVKIEFARPIVYAAAAQLAQNDAHSRARVSHARLAAAEAADLACRTAIQVHGAMGYSWEVDVHFFLKRALALSDWWGDARFHRKRVAERMLTLPLGPEHTFAAERTDG